MKVTVKAPFYDDNGIHKIGDVIETASFDPFLMEKATDKVENSEPIKVVEEVKKATKKVTKK